MILHKWTFRSPPGFPETRLHLPHLCLVTKVSEKQQLPTYHHFQSPTRGCRYGLQGGSLALTPTISCIQSTALVRKDLVQIPAQLLPAELPWTIRTLTSLCLGVLTCKAGLI